MQYLTGGQLRDIELLVGISDVSHSGDHLLIKAGDNSLHCKNIATDHEALQHVDLGSLDFVVSVLFIPQSVLIKPVVNLRLSIERISEVRWARRGDPEFSFFINEKIVSKLFVFPIVVFLDDTEVSASLAYRGKVKVRP